MDEDTAPGHPLKPRLIDAGVAAGLALGVVESEYVSISGVTPILIYVAETGELMTIDGLGTWPRAASTRNPAWAAR